MHENWGTKHNFGLWTFIFKTSKCYHQICFLSIFPYYAKKELGRHSLVKVKNSHGKVPNFIEYKTHFLQRI